MLVSINGVAIIAGSVSYPLTGAWTADLVLDQPSGTGFSDGTSVTISATDSSGNKFSLSGTVQAGRNGTYLDAIHVRVVGGAFGLGKIASTRAYVQPSAFVRDVINGLMADSGETLSSTTDQTFLNLNLTAWHVTPKTVSQCIQLLVDIVNRDNNTTYNWRVLSDGTLWIGQETFPQAAGDFQIISQNPADASFELGVESPITYPGFSLPGIGNIYRVDHVIEPARIRQFVWQTISGVSRGFIGAIQAIVKQTTVGIDYFGLYEAKIAAQSADGTMLDVQPVDSRFAGTQRVSLRHGLPGLNVQVAPGSKILLGFQGGDPSKPYVHSWAGGETITSVKIGSSPDPVITAKDLQSFYFALNAATIVAQDGGASLKSTLLAGLALAGWSTGTTDGHLGSLTMKAQR